MNKEFENSSYVEIPNREDHFCFACSSNNEHGIKMEFKANDKEVVSEIIVADHLCGWDTLVHGGIIATILDEIMSWTTIYKLRKFILTKNMSVDYKRIIRVGESIKAIGTVIDFTEREANLYSTLYNDKNELCASSNGIYALFTSEAIRTMNILSEESILSIEKIINM